MQSSNGKTINPSLFSVRFANIVLCSGILLSIVFIVYSTYRLYYPLHQINFYVYLIVGFSAVIGIASLVLRSDSNTKIKFSLSIVSIFIAIYFVEILLQISKDETEYRKARIEQLGIPWDFRSKYDVVRDLRDSGLNAYPLVSTSYLPNYKNDSKQLVPLASISNSLTVYCNESGTRTTYFSDYYGFNNPREIYDDEDVEIVIFGDSFAEGACVESGTEDIGSIFRNNGLHTINFGRAGSGPLHQLAIATEYATSLRPKVALWLWTETNDLTDLQTELTSPVFIRYMDDKTFSQHLIERQDEVDILIKEYVENLYRLRTKQTNVAKQRRLMKQAEPLSKINHSSIFQTIKLLEIRTTILNLIKGPPINQRAAISRKTLASLDLIIRRFKDTVDEWGGTLYFVFLGTDQDFGHPLIKYPDLKFTKEVKSLVAESNIPTINITNEVLEQFGNLAELVPPLGGHYNALGYKLIGEAIIRRLKKDGKL